MLRRRFPVVRLLLSALWFEIVRKAVGPGDAFMRYALTTTLMGEWFDEFDLKLGHAVDPAQWTPWQNGVFRRRFQNGLALVNPHQNPDLAPRAAQTVTVEPGYRRFRGEQDPVTNNGESVTTLTLAAGDGSFS